MERMKNIVLAYLYGQHTDEIRALADGEGEDEASRQLTRYLLGELSGEELDATEGAEAIRQAIKAGVKEVDEKIYSYSFHQPTVAVVQRLGDLAHWPRRSFGFRGAEHMEVSFAQAVYILVHELDGHVQALARGCAPFCPMRGNHEFADAAIALVKVHQVWTTLRGNQLALVGFARWRTGLDVANGSVFQFMEALEFDREDLDDQVVVALAVLDSQSNFAWEAGRRNVHVPCLPIPFGQREWEDGRIVGRIKEEAPDVWSAWETRAIRHKEVAAVLYQKYQDEQIRLWIEQRVDDRKVENPADPFGEKVSAWALKKAELGL